MDIRLLFALLAMGAGSLALGAAYRWVDADGIVHYSDQPEPGAERIDLPSFKKPTSSGGQRTANPSTDSNGPDSTTNKPFQYDSLSVASPGAEQTLWNIEGVLNVSLALTPALRSGDQVRVYLDGNQQLETSLSFTLQEVYRGVHNVQAEVVDTNGKLMVRSKPVRFYVQQNTLNQPRRP